MVSVIGSDERTFVKTIHVQLSDERRNIRVLEVRALSMSVTKDHPAIETIETYAKTLENSGVGDMTKLSLVLDQQIRCLMLPSSSMLSWRLANAPNCVGEQGTRSVLI
jgi:hypothetical protein